MDIVIEERRGLGPEGERQAWGQEKEKGPSHPLLEFRLLLQGHGVSLSNDGDDVHNFAEVFHELQVERSQAGAQRRRGVRATRPSPLSLCHHSRGTLGTGGLGWELAG